MSLALTRKAGESVVLRTADGVEIRVLIRHIRGKRVAVNIEAPKAYAITREPKASSAIGGAA